MAYWIHENGETIGPLRAIEVLERAQPETLVSHGQQWLPLRDHPDFSTSIAAALSTNPNPLPKSGDRGSKLEVPLREKTDSPEVDDSNRQYWVLWPFSFSAKGPYSHEKVARELPVKILVRCGENWLPKDRHPDFVTAISHDQTRPESSVGLHRINRASDPSSSSGKKSRWGVILAITLLGVVFVSLKPPVNSDYKVLEKADTHWEAKRYDKAIAIYRNFVITNDSKSSSKPSDYYAVGSDYHKALKRLIEYYITTDDQKNIYIFVRKCISGDMVLAYSNEFTQDKFLKYCNAQIEKPVDLYVECRYSTAMLTTQCVAEKIWNAAINEKVSNRMDVLISVYHEDRFGGVRWEKCRVMIENLQYVRRYRAPEYFYNDEQNEDLIRIWIALKNI